MDKNNNKFNKSFLQYVSTVPYWLKIVKFPDFFQFSTGENQLQQIKIQ